MVLISNDLVAAEKAGDIVFSGDIKKKLNPNSINVSLSKVLKCYSPFSLVFDEVAKKKRVVIEDSTVIIDMKKDLEVYSIEIPEEGLIIPAGVLFLGATNEVAGSDKYIPMYEGRSSLARIGLQSHLSAGFGDIGFISQWTLEILCSMDTVLYPNIDIGQVYFVKGSSEYSSLKYKGKYNNQKGPQESKIKEDFA